MQMLRLTGQRARSARWTDEGTQWLLSHRQGSPSLEPAEDPMSLYTAASERLLEATLTPTGQDEDYRCC